MWRVKGLGVLSTNGILLYQILPSGMSEDEEGKNARAKRDGWKGRVFQTNGIDIHLNAQRLQQPT